MESRFKIFAAPLQGYTEAPYRHFHSIHFETPDTWFSPFVRIEKGEARRRDINDIMSTLNANHTLIPQIIFKDEEEFSRLVDRIAEAGFDHIDMNMGCPFPPQTARGRGAAIIARRDILESVARRISEYPEISFSAKMRLGLTAPDEWEQTIDIINGIDLAHLTVHPRIARQQYKGDLQMEAFGRLYEKAKAPLIFNGDIMNAADMNRIRTEFPNIAGVMVGRGLLANPALVGELLTGCTMPQSALLIKTLALHDDILRHYEATLCGDSQILSKIKPFWDYAEPLIGHKACKAVAKSNSLSRYRAALALQQA